MAAIPADNLEVPLSLHSRVAIVATCLLVAIGILAGTSVGSPPRAARATAPKLIAHDVSGFAARHRRAPAKPGPQLLKAYNDSVASDSDANVLNPSGDIGKTQYVFTVNGEFGIFTRTGLLLAEEPSSSFWAGLAGPDAAGLCATNPQGESSVSYDQLADRWVVAEAAYAGGSSPVAPFVECVAVSKTSDATGVWRRYVFSVSSTYFPNRPTLGVWSDGYYLSFNQHTADGKWAGAGALALERSKMLNGDAAQARYFDDQDVTPGLGGMLPANINGPIAPAPNAPELYLQAHDDSLDNNDRLEVWKFHVDWTTPALNASTFQPAPDNLYTNPNPPLSAPLTGFSFDTDFSCGQPATQVCLAQNSGSPLDPLAQAFSDTSALQARQPLPQLGGRLQWSATPAGDQYLTAVLTVNRGGNIADPAWFKLTEPNAGTTWGFSNLGIYDVGDNNSRFLPSVALDQDGNVGLAYALTGIGGAPTSTPGVLTPGYNTSVGYTEATNPAVGDHILKQGVTGYGGVGATWGRYTTLSLDPVDGCTFWFEGLYQDAFLEDFPWITHFKFGDCTVSPATEPPVLTIDPSWTPGLVREGLDVIGNPATFTTTGLTAYSYQWRLCDSGGLNCDDIQGASGTLANATDTASHTATATDAVGDRTLRYQETATNPNGSSTAVSAATPIVQSIPPVNTIDPVLTGTAQAGQTLSTTNGTWTSSSPVNYTYRWRRCTSGVCVTISGATSSSYLLAAADVGSTVEAVVSATNTGGSTDAITDPTVTVIAAPPDSGGSGGSGGGSSGGSGGAGSPDLAVTGTTSNTAPNVGDNVTFFLTVTDKNSALAQNLYVNLTLPAGLTYVSSAADRGSGCMAVSATSVKCFLDFLSGAAPVGHLQVVAKATTTGAQILTATATCQQGVFSAAGSTLSLTVNPTTATTTTTTSSTTAGIPTGLNGSGTTTTKAKSDKKAPTSAAIASTGKRGATVKLRFRIYDDLGVAKALATIKRNGKSFATKKTGFGPVAYGTTYFLGWHVPASAPKGTYRFCVVAVDRAGNHSRSSCAALKLK